MVIIWEAAVTKRDDKAKSGTFADLRGILSGKVRSLTDEELRQWIDEARSRGLPDSLKKDTRTNSKIQDTQD